MKIYRISFLFSLGIIVFISVIGIVTYLYFAKNSNIQGLQTKNTQTISTAADSAIYSDYIIITETPIPTPTKRPTPTPTITPTRIPVGALEDFFAKYSKEQSVDRELLKRIAVCESGLNPNAIYGNYGGLFQFSENSWMTARRMMNLDTNPSLRFNPEEAIKTAAFKLAIGGRAAWPNCNK